MKRRRTTQGEPTSSKFNVEVYKKLQSWAIHGWLELDLRVEDEVPVRVVDVALPIRQLANAQDWLGTGSSNKKLLCIQLDHEGVHKGKQLEKDEKTDMLLRAKGHLVEHYRYRRNTRREVERVANLIKQRWEAACMKEIGL